jgi:hypothetical protein
MSSVTGPQPGGNHSDGDGFEALVGRVEGLVDRHSLRVVLRALVEMSHGKAEHLAVHWQDEAGGQLWGKVAEILEQVALSLPEGV